MNRRITATFLCLAAMRLTVAATDSQDEWVGPIEQAESRLRQQMRGENGPQEIYALLTEGTWGGFLGTPIAPKYFMTAEHVGGAIGQTFVFHGVPYTTTAMYDDPDSDLRIWRICGAFSNLRLKRRIRFPAI